MVNTSPFGPEARYDAYENYLANKRINVAPMLGTNVCLATVTLGLTEASTPYGGDALKSVETMNTFDTMPIEKSMGGVSIAQVISLDAYRNTPSIGTRAEASIARSAA